MGGWRSADVWGHRLELGKMTVQFVTASAHVTLADSGFYSTQIGRGGGSKKSDKEKQVCMYNLFRDC